MASVTTTTAGAAVGAGAVPDAGVAPGTSRVSDALSRVGDRARAVFRLALALVIAVVVVAGATSPALGTWIVLAAAGVYVVVSTATMWRPRFGLPGQREDLTRAVGDVIAICAVAVAVQDPRSALLLFLCAIPLSHSLTLSPTAIATVTASAILGSLGVWAAGIVAGNPGVTEGGLLVVAFTLGWAGLIACLIAVERERRANRIMELSGTLQDLIRQVITAEATERQRVADLLHDDVLQLLIVTRHDVTDAIEGDLDALPSAGTGIDAATRHLRETIGGLRTDGVAARRLGDGIRQLADQSGRRRGFTVRVDVASSLQDGHHPLLLSLARDLLRNAERSSAPTQVTLRIHEEGDDLLLRLAHDDRRFDPGRPDPHDIFLTIDQRTRAAGGSFTVCRLDDGERQFAVRIPLRAPRDSASPDAVPPTLTRPAGTPGQRRGEPSRHHRTKAPYDVHSR